MKNETGRQIYPDFGARLKNGISPEKDDVFFMYDKRKESGRQSKRNCSDRTVL